VLVDFCVFCIVYLFVCLYLFCRIWHFCHCWNNDTYLLYLQIDRLWNNNVYRCVGIGLCPGWADIVPALCTDRALVLSAAGQLRSAKCMHRRRKTSFNPTELRLAVVEQAATVTGPHATSRTFCLLGKQAVDFEDGRYGHLQQWRWWWWWWWCVYLYRWVNRYRLWRPCSQCLQAADVNCIFLPLRWLLFQICLRVINFYQNYFFCRHTLQFWSTVTTFCSLIILLNSQ